MSVKEALPLLEGETQEWYSVEYWDDEAGTRFPFEYPDEVGWVTALPCDGTLEHAKTAMDIYGVEHPKIRIVRNNRQVVISREAT